ncbi:hypothetical protein CRM22_005971 [Opisthorchis felineus]|uniref:RNA-polymerase II-associated protein 3-like C-terminal domain-containing protein n=1 Tax=Opisthorchis felineus TaxID=147828 RepID=A0A4S2LNB8_OPIFE|nr:hypothetical protein CRM22_005971 [Opisthorchis felineus]
MTDHIYHNERTKSHDIPIAHLDFKYIKECKDIKELEKIMKTLRSGEVGHYAELERCCEECIRNIDPDNRVLRVSMPLGSLDQLDQPSREAIETGFQNWLEEMKSGDAEAGENLSHEVLLEHIARKRAAVLESEVEDKGLEYDDEVPAVRREIFFRGNSKSAIRARCDGDGNKPKRIVKPRDYSEWDKLEKEWDKELSDTITDASSNYVQSNTVVEKGEKMDVSDTEIRSIQKLNLTELAKRVESLPDHTRRQMAVREKEKGNEAFHAGDYNEALVYYKRSLTILPMAAVYNNRALIYLHQKQWSAAAKDCARVLQEEPNNSKALFRSGRANYELHNLEQAERDLERLTDQEPTNTKAQALLRNVRVAKAKRQASRLAGGRRMLITEEGDSESSDEDTPTNSQREDSHSAQPFDSHNSQSSTDMRELNVQQSALVDSSGSTEKLISQGQKGQTMSPAGCSKNIPNQIPTGEARVRARKVYYPSNPGPYGREGMVIEELSDNDEPAQPQPSSPTEKSVTDGERGQVKTPPQVNHCKETKANSLQSSGSSQTSQKQPGPEMKDTSSTSRLDKERIMTFDEAKEQGKELLGQGDLQKALEAYTRSIELASGDPEQLALSYRNRALVALRMNENTKAIEDCNHAITIEPQNPVSYYRRALGLRALKNYEDSLRDLEKAYELRPCSENIRSELQKARVLVESNSKKEGTASEFGTDAEDSLGFEVIDQPLAPSQDADGDSYSVRYEHTTDACDWQLVSEIVNESDLSKKSDDEEKGLKGTLNYLSETTDPTRITPCVFQNRWCSLRGLHAEKLHEAVIKLLHEAHPDRLNEVIGIKLDASMLDQVIRALCWLCLTSDGSNDQACDFAYKILKNLSNLPRFDCAVFLIEEPTIQGEKKRRHEYFLKLIQKHMAQVKEVHRIILIGTGESGKSTFVKQMKLLSSQNQTFTDKYREKFLPEIRRNLVQSLASILAYMEQEHISFASKEGTLTKAKNRIFELKAKIDRAPDTISQYAASSDPQINDEFYDTCRMLWADIAVKETQMRGNEFQLIDCAQHFLDKIDEIRDPSYKPSDEDVLQSRTKTLGIHTESIVFNNVNFELVDVGGQREQRTKWIEAMSDGVTAVIFLTDVSAYDMMLAEDHTVNRLSESINLLGQVWTKSPLRDKSIILFLNKQDKLERKVREQRTQLETYFPEYNMGKIIFLVQLLREIKSARTMKTKKDGEVWDKYFSYFLPTDHGTRDQSIRQSTASDSSKTNAQHVQIIDEYNQVLALVNKAFTDNLIQGWSLEGDTDENLAKHLLTREDFYNFQRRMHSIVFYQVVSITTFIERMFLSKCDQSNMRHVYPFPTTAIDKRNVDRVFQSCKDILQGKALTDLIV